MAEKKNRRTVTVSTWEGPDFKRVGITGWRFDDAFCKQQIRIELEEVDEVIQELIVARAKLMGAT
jgi:hypothetical protein